MFGHAQVSVVPQNGLPTQCPAIIEGSTCFVQAAYFANDGTPFTPAAVRYRVDDVASGVNIAPWHGIVPGPNTITVTAGQNAMVSDSRQSESRQVIVQVQDAAGDLFNFPTVYSLLRVVGLG